MCIRDRLMYRPLDTLDLTSAFVTNVGKICFGGCPNYVGGMESKTRIPIPGCFLSERWGLQILPWSKIDMRNLNSGLGLSDGTVELKKQKKNIIKETLKSFPNFLKRFKKFSNELKYLNLTYSVSIIYDVIPTTKVW